MGYRWNDFVSNQRLFRKTESRPITSIVHQQQLRLYGHVARYPAFQVISERVGVSTKFVAGASRCFLLGVNWYGKGACMGTCMRWSPNPASEGWQGNAPLGVCPQWLIVCSSFQNHLCVSQHPPKLKLKIVTVLYLWLALKITMGMEGKEGEKPVLLLTWLGFRLSMPCISR